MAILDRGVGVPSASSLIVSRAHLARIDLESVQHGDECTEAAKCGLILRAEGLGDAKEGLGAVGCERLPEEPLARSR